MLISNTTSTECINPCINTFAWFALDAGQSEKNLGHEFNGIG